MSEVDRTFEGSEQAIATLLRRVDELEARTGEQWARRPTGDTELAFRTTPKAGTLFLHGQTLNRADFPTLWAWAQAHGAVVAGGYGAGNGSTTFTLPDMRGKVVRGVAATGEALGAQVGADSRALTETQMPVHDHTGTAATAGSHIHDSANGEMGSAGSHDGHVSQSNVNHAVGTGGLHGHPPSWGDTDGGHSHFFTFDILSAGSHSHSVTIGNAGGTTPVDLRQASLGWHLAVWT